MVSLLNTSKEFLLKYGENIDTTTTLVGTFDRKLSNSQTNKIISRILRSLGAEMVEKVDDGFYTAVTAYTPYIEQSVHFFNKTVNLNIAIRYNAYEDLTYIIIATPLITTTY